MAILRRLAAVVIADMVAKTSIALGVRNLFNANPPFSNFANSFRRRRTRAAERSMAGSRTRLSSDTPLR